MGEWDKPAQHTHSHPPTYTRAHTEEARKVDVGLPYFLAAMEKTQPSFLHRCQIKSGSGLGMRLGVSHKGGAHKKGEMTSLDVHI